MTSEEPFANSRIIYRANEMEQSSRNENTSYDFPDSCVTHQPNSWFRASCSLDTVSEVDDFQQMFEVLMDVEGSKTSSVQADTSIASDQLETSCEPDIGQSSGTKMVLRKCRSDGTQASEGLKRELNGDRPKRTRSAELHNMSERRRRDRINKRLRILQELIPNCNKSDRASVLNDAVNYLKALKHQIELMSGASETILQAPYMAPSGIPSTQVPQISSFVSVRPELGIGTGLGMGVAGITYPSGVPMISIPLASLRPSLAEGVSFPLMSVHQMQVPLVHSQAWPPSADTSARLPNFVTGFPPAASSFSSQAKSGSQTIPSLAIDHQQVQMISQESHPSVSSSSIPAMTETVAISESS